jgi:hypothetical protein
MLKKPWSPYLAGGLTGVLLALSVLVSGHFFGGSTTFARGASVIEQAVGIDISAFEYFTAGKGKYGPSSLPNWQLLFIGGIMVGAFAATKLSRDFKFQAVPDMWRERFGPSPLKRAVVAFIGGMIGLFGARLAGG